MASDVEVADLAQAVAAELERVGEHADAVLADVERVASEIGRPRIAIRHDHVGERGAIQDRPLAALVEVADGVQDQAFARREADPEAPLLPADLVSVDREARPLRLVDLDGLQVGARRRRPHGE